MEYLLNEITFALPCRRFMIDYSVNDKRTLPVVKEFVVRFLFTLQSCPESLISSYFGFSPDEQREVLLDMEKEKLIVWKSDEVMISDYAKKSFEEKNGKVLPRFFEIKDELDFVEFELFSLTLITQKVTERRSYNAVEVNLPPESLQDIQGKIKGAFDAQFSKYLEEVKHVDIFSDSRELYKINSVSPKAGRMLPVGVKFILDTNNTKSPIIKFVDTVIEEMDENRKIWSFVNEYLQDGSYPVIGQEQYVKEYLECTGDPVLALYCNNGKIDLMSFLKSYDEGGGDFEHDTRMIVGHIYLPKNMDTLIDLLDLKYGKDKKIPAVGALWSSYADGRFWGRSSSFTDFTGAIKKRFDHRYKPGEIVLCMSFDEGDWDNINEMKNIFDHKTTKVHLQGMDVPFGNIQCELFLIPGVVVACLFHLNMAGFGNQTIPLGFVSTNEKLVAKIQSELCSWNENSDVFNYMFEKKGVRTSPKETIFNKYTSPLLKWEDPEIQDPSSAEE